MTSAQKHSPFQKAIAIGLLIIVASVAAFATATALTTQVLVQNNAQVTAGALAITVAACDNTNGNSFTFTGREVLLLQNTDSSAHTVTLTPVVDQFGGTNSTFTAYSIPATSFAAVQMKFSNFATAGVVSMTCNSNLIKIAVLQTN